MEILYCIGDKVIYGRTGVCEVTDILEKCGPDGTSRIFYSLHPLYQRLNITVAADNDKVVIRPVVSRDEAEKLIDGMSGIDAEPFHCPNLTQLKEHYRLALKNESCESLIALTMSLYRKRSQAQEKNKKFGAVDERFMHEAEELLFGELAAALDMEKDSVRPYINKHLA